MSDEVSHDFWREFRKRIKNANPDCYILGENWDASYPWLMGDQMDGVMNYGFMNCIWGFLGMKEEVRLCPVTFRSAMDGLLTRYPRNVTSNLFNLLDSHDTARILTVCGGNIELVKLAYVFLLTLNGSPSIYYGDEVGMDGDKHTNRKCMVWEKKKQNQELLGHVRKMTAIRKRYGSCRRGEFTWILADNETGTVIFRKKWQEEELYVCVHNREAADEVRLPRELSGTKGWEVYREQSITLKSEWEANPYDFLILKINR